VLLTIVEAGGVAEARKTSISRNNRPSAASRPDLHQDRHQASGRPRQARGRLFLAGPALNAARCPFDVTAVARRRTGREKIGLKPKRGRFVLLIRKNTAIFLRDFSARFFRR